jgi:hypothetical protein
MSSQTETVQTELIRRHKATATTVKSLMIGVVLLSVLAFVGSKFLTPRNSAPDMVVNIIIVVFGLGAITLRRTRFARMRLQDIGALQGPSGLLITLEKTTFLVALVGAVIALVGFVATLANGSPFYTYQAGVIALAVLLYCYPIRASWEQAVRRYSSENGPETGKNA